MIKNNFIQIGSVIINKNKINSIKVKKYSEQDTYFADIIVNYTDGKRLSKEIINISVFYLPEDCDPKGRLCENMDEINKECCLKCDGAKKVKKAAYKEFQKLIDEKLEKLRVLLGIDIVNSDESTSFSLSKNGAKKQ